MIISPKKEETRQERGKQDEDIGKKANFVRSFHVSERAERQIPGCSIFLISGRFDERKYLCRNGLSSINACCLVICLLYDYLSSIGSNDFFFVDYH